MTLPLPSRRIGPVLAALALGACTGERARPESAEVILRRASEAASGAHATEATPGAREEGVPDLEPDAGEWTLARVLEGIAVANPTLGQARARLEEARAAERAVAATRWPELSLAYGYARTDNPAQAFAHLLDQERLTLGPDFDPTPGAIENWRKELRLDWAVLAPGRAAQREAARAGEEEARLAGEAAEVQLLNAGVRAWIGLGAARELEQVARASLEVVAQRLEQTRTREREGAALRADVLRLEVRLAATRQEAAQATLVAREAESGLNRLLGRAPDAPLRCAPEASGAPAIGVGLPEDLESLQALAASRRQDLAAAAHAVRALGFQREAAQAGRQPELFAYGAYDIDGAEPGIETELGSTSIGIGLRLALSARTGPAIHAAEARERGARERLRAQTLAVAGEVRDAWEARRVADEVLALAEASLGAAEEAYRIVAEAQDAGAATVTDVLEAEDALRHARSGRVAARAGVELARARLVGATGGIR